MRYRAIALDLDGTLLTPEKTILPESLDALQRAREAGIKVIIATGRHHCAILPFYQALQPGTPAICCNGTYLYDFSQRAVLTADPLEKEQTLRVLELLQQHAIHGLLYVDDAMLYQEPTGHVVRTQNWAQSLPEHQRPTFIQVPDLAQAAREAESIWKFALSHPDTRALQQFAETVERELGLACEWSWHDQVDIARAGNNKGRRLAEWAAGEGIPMEEIIAFGDNYNDISMLKAVGLGVAMANADDAVKQQANAVTTTNLEPGIAATILREVL